MSIMLMGSNAQGKRDRTIENAVIFDAPSIADFTITNFAHKAGVVGDPFVRAVLAALDVSAERGCATGLDRRHDLQLVEAHVTGVGLSPCRPIGAKDVGDLQGRPRHAGAVRRAAFSSSA